MVINAGVAEWLGTGLQSRLHGFESRHSLACSAAGLPQHRYPLERCADAHRASEEGAVGKVLIDVTS